jgi:hypothetical protein
MAGPSVRVAHDPHLLNLVDKYTSLANHVSVSTLESCL